MAENETTEAGEAGGTAAAATTSAPATAEAAEAVEAAASRENRRKVREGIVVSTAMEKTAVVAVTERVRHRRYAKTVQRTRKLYVHDEENEAANGDRVRVAETRPYSKSKRWRLVAVLERAR
ncbi:MAG: 30S ribosomal protein S17 [Acidimicrobiales bacterium]|jgi:small subunit ribosomal protein S17